MLRLLAPAVLLTASLFAQAPFFEASRVQIPNSAETTPLGPGELVSVYGSHLGPAQFCQGHADPNLRETPNPLRQDVGWNNLLVFPKELCGVRVMVGGEPAGLLYVHRDQINFKVPQNVPLEGTVGLQIVHRGQSSEVVQIAAGLAPLRLILPEPAFTNMPIWVQVKLPPNRGAYIQYPYSYWPADIGCNELQLRKDGRLLERTAPARGGAGVHSGPICGSGSYGNGYGNRLPLHLLYRIEEPGDYEVRLKMGRTLVWNRALTDDEVFIQSEWTPMRVEAATQEHRRQWLGVISKNPPVAPADVTGDYLPNILGVPDAHALQAVVDLLYHPHYGVGWSAQGALSYWSVPEALEAVQRTSERRGPSAAAIRWLLMQRTSGVDFLTVVEASLPYLRSSDFVALQGAISAVRSLSGPQISKMPPGLRGRAFAAMIAAERYVLATGDHDTSQDYVQGLAVFRDDRAAPILWRFVDEGIALGPSLQAIALLARPEDLPRLAAFIGVKHMPPDYYSHTNGLIEALVPAYGAEALSHIQRVIKETDDPSLRDDAGRALVSADLPEAWVFIAEAIENDAPYKADVMRYIGARYPESNATQEAMLALAKRLAAGSRP
jgi:hypothetical protein